MPLPPGASKASTEELLRVNVEGTDRLLDPCIKNGVKHFIFTSTANVYGKRRKDDLTEESDTRPTDKYGYSKMLAEKVIIESGVPYTIEDGHNVRARVRGLHTSSCSGP